ncbi:hypothetical protein PmNV_060 [Penaeus monodon nudivirus]|uniref:Uncharacterized protein n=1 Tax=Penaeus monodon nudivirus TaxID=1529056 RepID=A0A076FD37_9VIRU|nr:hypothetical protein PmNV_060 [Penaeus monodon nudivirus]AII15848.1 hypothetical protein PmNV_060 [Penaeus monodon nudivirus]
MDIKLINNVLDFRQLAADVVIYENTKILKTCGTIYFNILYDTFGKLGKELMRFGYKEVTVQIKEVSLYTKTSIIFNVIRIVRLIGIEKLTIIY